MLIIAGGGGGGPPVDVFLSLPLFLLSVSLAPFDPPRLVLRSLGMPPANSPASCCGGSATLAAETLPLFLLSALTLLRFSASMLGADLSTVSVLRSPPLPNDAMSPNKAFRPPPLSDDDDWVAEAEKRAAGLLLQPKPAAEGGAGAEGGPGGGGGAEDGTDIEGGGGGGGGALGGGEADMTGAGDDGGVGRNIPVGRVIGGASGLESDAGRVGGGGGGGVDDDNFGDDDGCGEDGMSGGGGDGGGCGE